MSRSQKDFPKYPEYGHIQRTFVSKPFYTCLEYETCIKKGDEFIIYKFLFEFACLIKTESDFLKRFRQILREVELFSKNMRIIKESETIAKLIDTCEN